MSRPTHPKIDSVWYDPKDTHNWRVGTIYHSSGNWYIYMRRADDPRLSRRIPHRDWDSKEFEEVI